MTRSDIKVEAYDGKVKPLTRKEVESWPPLGPMNLDPARVLELLERIEKLQDALDECDEDLNDTE